MIGLIAIFILLSWFIIVALITRWGMRRFLSNVRGWKKAIIFIPLYIFLLIFPVIDEVIGGFQFNYYCNKFGIETYESSKEEKSKKVYKPEYEILRGKTIKRSAKEDVYYPPSTVELKVVTIYYNDVETEMTAAKHMYVSMGRGFLGSFFGFSSNSVVSCQTMPSMTNASKIYKFTFLGEIYE